MLAVSRQIALFALGEQTFALPVEGIVHILPQCRLFPLPLLKSGFSGIFHDQAAVIPLLKLQRHLPSLPINRAAAPAYFIVYSAEAGTVGLPADKVLQVVERDRGVLAETSGESNFANFSYRGGHYPLLDVDAMLAQLTVDVPTMPCPTGAAEA